jgi:hypothetical protein
VTVTPVALASISAEYTQTGTIYTSTKIESLADLKEYGTLTVTATNNDGTTPDVTNLVSVSYDGKKVTLSYGGETCEVDVEVTAVAVESISATFTQTGKETIYSSTTITTADELAKYVEITKVTATNNDGSTDTVTGYEFVSYNDGVVTLSYGGKTGTFNVTVQEVTLNSISAKYTQIWAIYSSTEIASVEDLQKYGTLTVTASYDGGASKTVTGTFESFENGVVTLSYGGKTTTFNVEVTAVDLTSISVKYTQSSAIYASTTIASVEDLQKYGTLTVTANYADGASKPVTGTFESFENGVVTLSYTDNEITKTDTINVLVTSVALSGITAEFTQGDDTYTCLSALADITGLTVTANYNDGTKVTLESGDYTLKGTFVAGTQTFVAEYQGCIASFEINVSKATPTVEISVADGALYTSSQMPQITCVSSIAGTICWTDATLTSGEKAYAWKFTPNDSANYNEVTGEYTLSVSDVILSSISAEYKQSGISGIIYTSTAIESLDDLAKYGTVTVTATYNDGAEKTVTGYEFVSYADGVVTLSYTENDITKECEVQVEVTPVALTSISAAFAQNKEIYSSTSIKSLGELETYGVVTVTARYADGASKTVTGYEFVSYADGVVTLSYEGKTCEFEVAVTAVELTSIAAEFVQSGTEKLYATTKIESLEDLQKYGTLEVTASYGNGAEKTVTTYTFVSYVASNDSGVVTISYGGAETTFTLDFSPVELTSVSASFAQSETEKIYTSTTIADLDALANYGTLTVTAHYSDGTEKTVTDYTFVSYANGIITVSYSNISATATVTVTPLAVESITVSWTQTETIYSSTKIESVADLKKYGTVTVTATYNDTTTADVTNSVSVNYENGVVTISYEGKTDKFTVEFTPVALASISAEYTQEGKETIYSSTTITSLEDLKKYVDITKVTATYADNASKTVTGYKFVSYDSSSGVVTLSYTENDVTKPCEVAVTVTPVALASISAEYTQTGTIYTSTKIESLADLQKYFTLTVTATNNDKSTADVTNSVSVSYEKGVVTISYEGKTDEIKVEVTAVAVESISAEYKQTGTIYSSTTISSLEDLKKYVEITKVTATNNDGSTDTVTGYEFVSYNDGVVTLSYDGKTGTFNVTVQEVTLNSISAKYTQIWAIYSSTEIASVEDLQKYGTLTVTASYDGGASKTVTGTFESFENGVVTLSYGGKTTTFNVEVTPVDLTSISVKYTQSSAIYASTEIASVEDLQKYGTLTVTATYADGASKPVTGTFVSYADGVVTLSYTDNEITKTVSFDVIITAKALVKITTIFTLGEGSEINTSTKVDELANYGTFTITEYYNDGSTAEVIYNNLEDKSAYSFGGTLTEGTAVITVTYGASDELYVSECTISNVGHVHTLAHYEAHAATCEKTGNKEYWYCAACEKYYLESEAVDDVASTDTVTALVAHTYGEPSWSWNYDEENKEYKATATITCTVCGAETSGHSLSQTVTATKGETTSATCTTDGYTLYSAKVELNGTEYTNTEKFDKVTATGHSYEVKFVWAADNKSATAYYICANDASDTGNLDVVMTSEVTLAPTCSATGKANYTANTVYNGEKKTDTKEDVELAIVASAHALEKVEGKAATCEENGYEAYYKCKYCDKLFADSEGQSSLDAPTVITKLNHNYQVVFAWDGYTATAKNICQNDSTHTVDLTVEMSEETTTAATCTANGTKTHIATVRGTEYTESKDETLAKIAHSYGAPEWIWANDYSTATATFTCTSCKTEKLVVIANVEPSTSQDLTQRLYKATVEVDFGDKTYTDEKTVEILNHVHNYTFASWSWNEEDLTDEVTATFACDGCDIAHYEKATPVVTTVAATCTEDGKVVYLATVTYDGKTYSDTKTVAIEKLNHKNMVEVEAKAATCTTAGNSAYRYCPDCGKTFPPADGVVAESIAIPATGHEYRVVFTWNEAGTEATSKLVCAHDETHSQLLTVAMSDEVTAKATCADSGVKTYTATVVYSGVTYKDQKSQTIAKTAHSAEKVASIAATCTENGNSEYWYCTECGKYFADSDCAQEKLLSETVIAATGHNLDTENIAWTWAEGYSSAFATLTCKTCEQDVISTATVTSVEGEENSTTYTATITIDGENYTNEVVKNPEVANADDDLQKLKEQAVAEVKDYAQNNGIELTDTIIEDCITAINGAADSDEVIRQVVAAKTQIYGLTTSDEASKSATTFTAVGITTLSVGGAMILSTAVVIFVLLRKRRIG